VRKAFGEIKPVYFRPHPEGFSKQAHGGGYLRAPNEQSRNNLRVLPQEKYINGKAFMLWKKTF